MATPAQRRIKNRERREALAEALIPLHCEVCGHRVLRETRLARHRACFDHNHGTGKFRGWLCHACNVALGMAGDNPDLLVALAEYLRTRGHSVTRQVLR